MSCVMVCVKSPCLIYCHCLMSQCTFSCVSLSLTHDQWSGCVCVCVCVCGGGGGVCVGVGGGGGTWVTSRVCICSWPLDGVHVRKFSSCLTGARHRVTPRPAPRLVRPCATVQLYKLCSLKELAEGSRQASVRGGTLPSEGRKTKTKKKN